MEINPALGLRQVQHKPAPDPRLALIPAKCASQKSWLRPSLNLPQWVPLSRCSERVTGHT